MTVPTTEVAVIDLENTTDAPLKVSLVIGGVTREIVTLQPGESTRQATPSGVSWVFSPATDDGQESEPGDQPPPSFDKPKGPQAGIDSIGT